MCLIFNDLDDLVQQPRTGPRWPKHSATSRKAFSRGSNPSLDLEHPAWGFEDLEFQSLGFGFLGLNKAWGFGPVV